MAKGTTTKLHTGAEMPLVGLGTWLSGPGEVTKAVEAAIDLNYRHIDCAACYGNEKEVGAALSKKVGESKGQVKRSEIFITSKLWNNAHHPEDVEGACRQTLSDLGLSYLDLYLIHWPVVFKRGKDKFPRGEDGKMLYGYTPLVDTWKAMEKLVSLGLVKAIGISNFNKSQIEQVLKAASIRPAVLQIENHPYLTQAPLLRFCAEQGIVVTAYSPLGNPGRYNKQGEPRLITDTKVAAIAKRHGKTQAQVLIRFQVERGVVVIPKSTKRHRIEENFGVFDFTLSREEIATMEKLNIGLRLGIPTIKMPDGTTKPRDESHPFYPFKSQL